MASSADDLKSQVSQTFQSDASPTEIAQTLSTLIDDDDGQSDDSSKRWPIGETYNALLSHIRLSTTHDSPLQSKLIDVLLALKQKRDLGPLGICVRDAWNGELNSNNVEQWASLNAFAARMTQAQVSNFDLYAIWAFRPALEASTTDENVQKHIPAAAVWMFYAGSRLYDLSKKSEAPEDWGRAARGGARWEGPDGYSIERWNLWKQSFKESSSSDSKYKDLAGQAYDTMSSLETDA
jgi:hypothetical protein